METNTISLTATAEGNIQFSNGTFTPDRTVKFDGRTALGKTIKNSDGYTVVTGWYKRDGYTNPQEAAMFSLDAWLADSDTVDANIVKGGRTSHEVVMMAVITEYTAYESLRKFKNHSGELSVSEGITGSDIAEAIREGRYAEVLASIARAEEAEARKAAYAAAAEEAKANTPLSTKSQNFLRLVQKMRDKQFGDNISERFSALVRDCAMVALNRAADSIGEATGYTVENIKVVQFEDIAVELMVNIVNDRYGYTPRELVPAVTQFVTDIVEEVNRYSY